MGEDKSVYLVYDMAVFLNRTATACAATALVPTSPLSRVVMSLIAALSGGVCRELTVRVKMVASPVVSGVCFVDFSA